MKNLLRLTEFWYDYVGQDHHKDRDCHFFINQFWSYGRPPVYRIEHYGYISELPEVSADRTFETFEEAYDHLYEWLNSEIQDVFKHYESIDEEKEKEYDYNIAGVKQVLEKYKDLKQ